MDGTALAGGLSGPDRHAPDDFVIAPATRADDPELRRLLRENPMGGSVRISLEREPDAFLAASVEGDPYTAVVIREAAGGRLVGMGSRAVMDVFVNGRPCRAGYLGQLRLVPDARRSRRLLARGYRAIRRLRAPDELPYDFTSILAENHAALRLLGRGLPGLPTYRPLERFVSVLIPCRPERRPRTPSALEIVPGSARTLPAIAACLERNARRHQLARRWSLDDLSSEVRCRGLRPEDFRIALHQGVVVGCAALWNQSGFKQVVVRGYAPPLRRWRPLVNGLAGILGTPRLPDPGEAMPHAYLSHVAVDGDEAGVFAALLAEVRAEAARRGLPGLVAGFAARHPLLSVLRRCRGRREYESLLHVVHWEDGRAEAEALNDDGRIPHLEVALL